MIIVRSDTHAQHTQLFDRWLRDEWGEVGPLQYPEIPAPEPLYAVEKDELCGGLTFVVYPHPVLNVPALWINAVYVEPRRRGLGIGTLLATDASAGGRSGSFRDIRRGRWNRSCARTSNIFWHRPISRDV